MCEYFALVTIGVGWLIFFENVSGLSLVQGGCGGIGQYLRLAFSSIIWFFWEVAYQVSCGESRDSRRFLPEAHEQNMERQMAQVGLVLRGPGSHYVRVKRVSAGFTAGSVACESETKDTGMILSENSLSMELK